MQRLRLFRQLKPKENKDICKSNAKMKFVQFTSDKTKILISELLSAINVLKNLLLKEKKNHAISSAIVYLVALFVLLFLSLPPPTQHTNFTESQNCSDWKAI